MSSQDKDIGYFFAFLRRRRWQILLPALALFAFSLAVALLLPPTYRSTATILIEEQEIPPDLVRSTITSYADQRIQVISQQVMTRANMLQIVQKFDLYTRLRAKQTSEAVVEKLRKSIRMNMLSADVIDKRSGNKSAATIAFTLSYDGETPEQTQRVTNELASLYLNENLKNRQEKAADTTRFLEEEAKKLAEQVSAIEQGLAQFKQKNVGRLPELTQINIQMRERSETESIEVDRQISSLLQRKSLLESQLVQVKPYSLVISSTGERVMEPDERLQVLQSQYATASSVYSADHPDVQKLKREIEGLKKQGAGNESLAELDRQIEKTRGDLLALKERYSDEHPDVLKLRDSLGALEVSRAKESAKAVAARPEARQADNPAYLTIKAQLDGADTEIRTLRTKQAALQRKIADYNQRLAETPQIERQYLDISREYENATKRYQEVRAKLMEAQVGQELERDRKGERFSLIEPPELPEKPFSPNRRAIAFLGFVLSTGVGFAYGGALEATDRSIRGVRALAAAIRAPVLGAIPHIASRQEQRRVRLGRFGVIALIVAIFLAILFWIHAMVIPLDVAFYKMLRLLGR